MSGDMGNWAKGKRRANCAGLRRRRGLALVLVVTVMALAAVLAYAMLSSTALQATASDNLVNGAVADAQAESGVHLAMYYLLNPQNAPAGLLSGTPMTTTFAPSSDGPAIPGAVTITITPNASAGNVYAIQSQGFSDQSTGKTGLISRTVNATVQTNSVYEIGQAAGGISALWLSPGSTLSSAGTTIKCDGQVTIQSGAAIGGDLAASLTSGTYSDHGATYNAATLPSGTLDDQTLSPDPVANPLGVFCYDGNVTVGGNVTINGTLMVTGGTLTVTGQNNTITSQGNMPALLIDQSLSIVNQTVVSAQITSWKQ